MRFLLSLAFLLAPTWVFAATDVDIVPGSVSYSKEVLYSGDTVRIYATLRAQGDSDVSGTVSFHIGEQLVGSPQISLKAGGVKEEVFVDFVVPEGSFNVRVEIKDVVPAETNVGNNVTITALSTPIHDDDRDTVVDEQDNCPAGANADQRNTDSDAQGDVCDPDKDNDGLTNEEEATKGTDPIDADTDDDGKPDKTDPTPLGEPLKAPEQPKPAVITAPPSATAQQQAAAASSQAAAPEDVEGVSSRGGSAFGGDDVDASENEATPEQLAAASSPSEASTFSTPSTSSTSSTFSFEEQRWASYTFLIVAPETEEGVAYRWDFGDGSTSQRKEVTHTYAKAGSYTARLSVSKPDGTTTEDVAQIDVPFFDMDNSAVRLLLASLFVLFIVGISLLLRAHPTGAHEPKHKK